MEDFGRATVNTGTSTNSKIADRRILIVVVIILCVLPCVAQLPSAIGLVRRLQVVAKMRDTFQIKMELGKLYEDGNDLDNAIACYRTALPEHWNNTHACLDAWERLKTRRPSDPKIRLGFGEALQKIGALDEAELEYKRVLTLSPAHRNAVVESLLFALPKLRHLASAQEAKDVENAGRQLADVGDFQTAMRLGNSYQQNYEWAGAIQCYRKAAELPHCVYDQSRLVETLEETIKYRPFDPAGHIALGRAFQNYDGIESCECFDQTEAEYKQAISISPGQRNAVAEQFLTVLPRIIQDARKQRAQLYGVANLTNFRLVEATLSSMWHPPAHDGYSLTRIRLYVNGNHKIFDPELIVSSGSEALDRSALEFLKSGEFINLEERLLPFCCGGMYDFACTLDNGTRSIVWTAGGQFNEVTNPDGENLIVMIGIVGLGCGLIYFSCTQKRRVGMTHRLGRVCDAPLKYAATSVARVL